jgi:hypothetical protein
MSEDRVIRNMRNMAWERAKGELNAMLHTFWDGNDNFEKLKNAIDEFTKEVEDNGLHE